jgi:hypothetical protein
MMIYVAGGVGAEIRMVRLLITVTPYQRGEASRLLVQGV